MTSWNLALAAVACIVLSGCTGGLESEPPTTTPEPPAQPSAPPPVVLVDEGWTVQGTSEPPFASNTGSMGDLIGQFTITEPRNVTVHVEASSLNLRVFADNVGVFEPDGDERDGAAMSNAQYLNLASKGDATLTLVADMPGVWEVRFQWDHLNQADTIHGHTRVLATPV